MRVKKLIYTVVCMLFVLGALPSTAYAAVREDIERFPESYRAGLYALSEKYPNWRFECYDTGLDWNTVIKNEMEGARSLVGTYRGTNWYTEVYGQSWGYASKSAVEYVMDPRNFFTEEYIFQFEGLSYNAVCHTVEATQCILDSTFMSGIMPGTGNTYAHTFVQIGQELGVSPFHLASRAYQEQGLGTSDLISGTYPGYEGYYNYYNISATGSTDAEVVKNGLMRAKKEGWSSPYLSIRGGANFITKSYILRGQDTPYFQKFDVESSDNSIYSHQYMQNIEAPMSESKKTYRGYARYHLLDQAFVFRIPVFYNMPKTACLSPDKIAAGEEVVPEEPAVEVPEYIESLSESAGCFASFDGVDYWYEYGYLQGYSADDPNYRGKEIYDPESDQWYWLDNVQGGAKTVSKDVYQESAAGRFADNIVKLPDGSIDPDASTGKWVRYNESGHMVKGWDGSYYFDEIYGTMAKGYCTIMDENGTYIEYYFNKDTGVLERVIGEVPEFGWLEVDGISYWYEDYIRQGYDRDENYRGKEIYDAQSDAWYWLDNVQDGAKTINKDVYQESLAGDWGEEVRINEDGAEVRYGKWVRYDENGYMVKGWYTNAEGNTYFFDPVYGTMAKGNVWIDGAEYYFDPATGVLQ